MSTSSRSTLLGASSAIALVGPNASSNARAAAEVAQRYGEADAAGGGGAAPIRMVARKSRSGRRADSRAGSSQPLRPRRTAGR
jgi:hypothetical protein